MKSRETLIRLKKFQVDEKRRKVAQIETMIAEFDRMANDLEREIRVEQDRAGIHDPAHFAYPTYAKAAIARRENLKRSADELRAQLEDAKMALGEAFDELKKVELLDERDQMREREAENAAEQAELDSIALMRVPQRAHDPNPARPEFHPFPLKPEPAFLAPATFQRRFHSRRAQASAAIIGCRARGRGQSC